MADNRSALYVMQKLQSLGYNPIAAAAITGNLAHESSLNPTAKGDNGTSYGIAQWHNDRWANMVRWTQQNGLNANSLDGQIAFLDHELKTKYAGVYSQLKNASDLKQATAAFTMGFENPAHGETGNPGTYHGWGSRLGHATTLASLATGRPMADFAASGWKPTDAAPGESGPAAPGSGDVNIALGPPPATPDFSEEQTPMYEVPVAGGGGGGGLSEDREEPLYADPAAFQQDTSGLADIAQKVQRAKINKPVDNIIDPNSLAGLFKLPTIGAAAQMQAPVPRKFG